MIKNKTMKWFLLAIFCLIPQLILFIYYWFCLTSHHINGIYLYDLNLMLSKLITIIAVVLPFALYCITTTLYGKLISPIQNIHFYKGIMSITWLLFDSFLLLIFFIFFEFPIFLFFLTVYIISIVLLIPKIVFHFYRLHHKN